MQPLSATGLQQAAVAISGGIGTAQVRTPRPECTAAMRAGSGAVASVDPRALAGQVVLLSNTTITNIVAPAATFGRGLSITRRQASACNNVPITAISNGITTTTKSSVKSGPAGSFVLTGTVQIPGRGTEHRTEALGTSGRYGVLLSVVSVAPVSPSIFDPLLKRAIDRAKK